MFGDSPTNLYVKQSMRVYVLETLLFNQVGVGVVSIWREIGSPS